MFKILTKNSKNAAFERFFHYAAKFRHLKFLFNSSEHLLYLLNNFWIRVSFFGSGSNANETSIFIVSWLKSLRNLVLELHNTLTLVEKRVFVHATSLVEKCFPKLATVIFTAFEFLRKMKVFYLAFMVKRPIRDWEIKVAFFCHVSYRCFKTLGIFKCSICFIDYNYRFSIKFHKIFIVL